VEQMGGEEPWMAQARQASPDSVLLAQRTLLSLRLIVPGSKVVIATSVPVTTPPFVTGH
jgi:hypothetical protein